MLTLKLGLLLGAAVALGSSCASTPVPKEQLAMTQAAIAAAANNGADHQPEAAARLQQAREKLAAGENYIDRGANRAAAMTLEEGEADARVASAVAQARVVQDHSRKQAEDLSALQKTLLRRSSP